MFTYLKRRGFNFLMRYLYNLLTEDGVIKIEHFEPTKTKSKVFVSGVELSEGERRELITDMKALRQLGGYARLQKSLRAEATDKLVNKSATLDDMVAGKVMLYTLDVEASLIRRLSNLSK